MNKSDYRGLMSYQRIAARVLNTPLLLEPSYAKIFFSAMQQPLSIHSMNDGSGIVMIDHDMQQAASGYTNARSTNRYYHVADGIAIIPVTGTLVHKFGSIRPYSGMTGYDGLVYMVQQAVADPTVNGVLLDINSPGGEVAGCFDATDKIFSLSKQKPIASLCYDMTCSAAQAIASACSSRHYITQSGRAGSIGVMMAHTSFEKELAHEGIDVTLIYSGAHKVDGNPYEALPQSVFDKFQADTDALRNQFAQRVAHYTDQSVKKILAQEAQVYRATDAIKAKLADELVNGVDAVDVFREFVKAQQTVSITAGVTMTTETLTPQQQATTEPTPPAAPQQAATAVDERQRIQSILKCEAAEGRENMAEHLAFNTEMSVEEASKLLAVAPKEQQSPTAMSPLDTAMANIIQPNITGDDGVEENSDEAMVKQALAAHAQATGEKYEV